GDGSRLEERGGRQRDPMLLRDLFSKGSEERLRVDRAASQALASARIQLSDERQPLTILMLQAEGSDTAWAKRGVGPLHRPLNILGVIVLPPDDDQIFAPAGDVELALLEKAEIAGA